MSSPWKILCAVVFLCATYVPQLLAVEVPLKVFWRRDSETIRQETGNSSQPGFVILVPADPKAKFDTVPGQLRAALMLPKPGRATVKERTLPVSLNGKSPLVAMTHFKVDLSPSVEALVDDYLENVVQGRRFEPVIEIRGFTVNGEPATAAVIVPTYLDLEIDSKATSGEEDTIVFRAIYLPAELREAIVKPGNWATTPVIDSKAFQKCQISLAAPTDTLTFHFLDRAALNEALNSPDSAEDGIQFEFSILDDTPPPCITPQPCAAPVPPAPEIEEDPALEPGQPPLRPIPPRDSNEPWVFHPELRQMPRVARPRDSKREATTQQKQLRLPLAITRARTDRDAGRGRAEGKGYRINRPRALPKQLQPVNSRFIYFAPASNREMPLYLSGSFTHSSSASGKSKDIANFEVSFNPDEKLWDTLQALNFSRSVSIAPFFYAKMNTNGVVNDENVVRYQIPLRFDYYPRACCRDGKAGPETVFHLSRLRRVSLYTGFQGEATRITNKRTYGGVSELRFFLAKIASPDFSYKIQPLLGYEVGRYREQTSNPFTEADATGVIKGSDGKPVSEIQLVERRGTLSRLHGSVHSTLTIASKSSLNINYDMFRLLRPESYFDEKASAAGYFTPYKSGTLPTTYAAVDTTYSFIAAGRLEKGTRRYLEITYNQEFTKFFDVKFSYTRGELAPAFQFVNKFEMGLALKILGKDSANPR